MDDTTRICLTTFVFLALLAQVTSDSCNSYCDEEGYFKNGFDCTSSQDPICCGDAHERFCCSNRSLDASAYPPVYVCDKSSWWIFHWQIAIGMVGMVILILILAACCCQCCVKKTHRRHRRMAGRRHGRSGGRNAEDRLPRPPSFFSPEHPFAFTPPEYDSLPKDPPSYAELGQDNPALLLSPTDPAINTIARTASLPSYTSQVDANGDRRISDGTLPPYSSRNGTPNASRRSSVQSGIILNLSQRRSSAFSGCLASQAAAVPFKEKEEEDSPSGSQPEEGQSAIESQQSLSPVGTTSTSDGYRSDNPTEVDMAITADSTSSATLPEIEPNTHNTHSQSTPNPTSSDDLSNSTASHSVDTPSAAVQQF